MQETFDEELDHHNLAAAIQTLRLGKPNFGRFNEDPAQLAHAYRYGDPLWTTAVDALSSLQVNVGFPDHELGVHDPEFAKLHQGIVDFVGAHRRTNRTIVKGSPMDVSLRALEAVNKYDAGLYSFLRGGLKFLDESLLPGFYAKGKTEGTGYWHPDMFERVRNSLRVLVPSPQK